jgi:hypothetical protein
MLLAVLLPPLWAPPASALGPVTRWTSNVSDAYGWNSDPAYYSTIQFVDLNHDGKADVCGRGSDGIYCGVQCAFTTVGKAKH